MPIRGASSRAAAAPADCSLGGGRQHGARALSRRSSRTCPSSTSSRPCWTRASRSRPTSTTSGATRTSRSSTTTCSGIRRTTTSAAGVSGDVRHDRAYGTARCSTSSPRNGWRDCGGSRPTTTRCCCAINMEAGPRRQVGPVRAPARTRRGVRVHPRPGGIGIEPWPRPSPAGMKVSSTSAPAAVAGAGPADTGKPRLRISASMPASRPRNCAVAVGRVDRVADREHVVAQALRHRLVPRAAGLGERLPGVGGQRVGPQVAVVAGRVAVAREHVAELRRAVAHHDLRRHAERSERLALELVGVDLLRRRRGAASCRSARSTGTRPSRSPG